MKTIVAPASDSHALPISCERRNTCLRVDVELRVPGLVIDVEDRYGSRHSEHVDDTVDPTEYASCVLRELDDFASLGHVVYARCPVPDLTSHIPSGGLLNVNAQDPRGARLAERMARVMTQPPAGTDDHIVPSVEAAHSGGWSAIGIDLGLSLRGLALCQPSRSMTVAFAVPPPSHIV
jgi:hypothetical protein